jgi:folate-dependent phosphoribosylglycinamide formyltransferase PurN
MNIGIRSTTNYNKYAITLIYLLADQSFKPKYVILVKEPIYKSILRNIRLLGFQATLNKIFRLLGYNSRSGKRDYLRELALSRNINIPALPLSKVCKKMGIECLKFRDINSSKAIEIIKMKQLDILINAGRGIFKSDIINTLNIGILNAHMGFLPDFRGMNVLEWSLFYGRTIGVTLHFIARGIDTGDILLFKEIPIEPGDCISDLREKSSMISVDLIIEGIHRLNNGNLRRTKQLPEDGKQYFAMHSRLIKVLEEKLRNSQEREFNCGKNSKNK